MRVAQLMREARQALHVRRQFADNLTLNRGINVFLTLFFILLTSSYLKLGIGKFPFVGLFYFFFLLWTRLPTLPRRSEAELIAHPRGVLLLVDLFAWLPSLTLMSAALVAACVWRDLGPWHSAQAIHFTGLLLIALVPFQIAVLVLMVEFEQKRSSGRGAFSYAVFSAMTLMVALWIDWVMLGNLTSSEAILPYGLIPILFTIGAITLWLPPVVWVMARARYRCRPRELWLSMLTTLIGLVAVTAAVFGLCSNGFAAGEVISFGRRLILQCAFFAGLIVAVWRLLWLLPRIDVGTASVGSASRTSPKSASRAVARARSGSAVVAFLRSRAAVPARGGGGIWRVGGVLLAHVLPVGSHRRWPLLLALTGMLAFGFMLGMFTAEFLSLAHFAYVHKYVFMFMIVILACLGVLTFILAPFGVASSHRLYILGFDYQMQARHTMRCGLIFGALPVVLGIIYGLAPWPADSSLYRAVLVLVAITVLLLRATAVRVVGSGNAAVSVALPSRADLLILLPIIATPLPAPIVLTFAILVLVTALLVVWRRFTNPAHVTAWAKRAADDA